MTTIGNPRSHPCDQKNANLVIIPELDLVGVVMTLHYHYQLPAAATEASLADIEDTITARFAKPIHANGVGVEWATLDLSKPTTLEQRIKDKIANHGLEYVSLLEVEMELCARRNVAQRAIYKWDAEKIMQTGDMRNRIVEVGWYEMHRKVEAELMRGEGREKRKRGVCPEPAVEILCARRGDRTGTGEAREKESDGSVLSLLLTLSELAREMARRQVVVVVLNESPSEETLLQGGSHESE